MDRERVKKRAVGSLFLCIDLMEYLIVGCSCVRYAKGSRYTLSNQCRIQDHQIRSRCNSNNFLRTARFTAYCWYCLNRKLACEAHQPGAFAQNYRHFPWTPRFRWGTPLVSSQLQPVVIARRPPQTGIRPDQWIHALLLWLHPRKYLLTHSVGVEPAGF